MEHANGSKYAPVPGKIPGAAINLGGVDLILAPLNLDGVQAFGALQDELSAAKTFPDIAAVVSKMLALSLQRNYPDITTDQITNLLDTANVQTSMLELAKVSGMATGAPGELRPASQ